MVLNFFQKLFILFLFYARFVVKVIFEVSLRQFLQPNENHFERSGQSVFY